MTSQLERENNKALLGRLQKLERDNRNMKRAVALILVATAALIFMGQTGKNRGLDADSLIIRDGDGRVRMELGTGEDTSPILRMYDGNDNKKPSVVLSANRKGSGLSFWAKGASLPVAILTNGDDGPSLLLTDFTGSTLVKPASVNTYDMDRFSGFLGRTEVLNPKTGAKTKTSAASLTMFGKDDKVIWQAP